MSVARQSNFSTQRSKSRSVGISTRQKVGNASIPHLTTSPVKSRGPRVEKLPQVAPHPFWLRSLMIMQGTSGAIAFSIISVMLVFYGWTVYTQQMWSREYRKLEKLQRHERQLTATNEVLKNHLAQQAELPTNGLVTPKAGNAVFIPPAPRRQVTPKPAVPSDSKPRQTIPLGY